MASSTNPPELVVIPAITFVQLQGLIARGRVSTIYYGAITCWWTHDPQHLSLTQPLGPGRYRLPCDPRGGMLLETHEPLRFLEHAAKQPAHYGAHGLATFMAAHHLNAQCATPDGGIRPWCHTSWHAYDDAVTRYVALPHNRADHFVR